MTIQLLHNTGEKSLNRASHYTTATTQTSSTDPVDRYVEEANARHMNSNGGGFRGSLKRLFKDKSTSNSSIKNVGKENSNSYTSSSSSRKIGAKSLHRGNSTAGASSSSNTFSNNYGSCSAANTPVLSHRTFNNNNNGSVTDVRSRRTSQPSETGGKAGRSSSRGDSFIRRLSFKFRSGSRKSLDQMEAQQQHDSFNHQQSSDIGLPPQPNRTTSSSSTNPATRLYYNSITQTYVDNPSHPINAGTNASNVQSYGTYDNNARNNFYAQNFHQQQHQQQQQQQEEIHLNIDTMQKVFNIFDTDLDGSITIEDVQNVMNSLQFLQNELEMPSLDQIKIAFEKFDENKNGSIEFNEFLNILKSSAAQNTLSSNLNASVVFTNENSNAKSNNVSSINMAVQNGYLVNKPPQSAPQVEETKMQVSNVNNTCDEMFNDTAKENMRLIFEQFDKDNDGKITKNELNFVMCNLFPDETITEQDINEMLDAADLDRNGFIDFNEFANMFKLFSNNASHEIARIENQHQLLLTSSNSNLVQSKLTDLKLNDSSTKRNSRRSGQLKKNESSLYKSTKSLAKSLSRSNSKEGGETTGGKRSRTASKSQNQSANQSVAPSPSNYRKFIQIFTSSQMMDLKAAFTMFDKNGDQKISESELLQVMKYLGLNTTEKEVRAMIEVVDKNRNGFVDYDEFIQMMTNTSPKPINAEEELMKKTFQIFDIDGNGFITADEIKQTMTNLGENLTDAEVADMIKAADKNGDGLIDMNEFSGLINGVGGPIQFQK